MFDDSIREAVRVAYSAAASAPEGKHSFPVGENFAQSLGYSEELLRSIPAAAKESFAGVSNLSVSAPIQPGDTVLDLGCGAGLDSLIAAWKAGRSGRVCGVDFSSAMLEKARRSASRLGRTHATFQGAAAEALPYRESSFDVALVNGIFNLNPRRQQIFRELARVLRPGGRAFVAELILREPLPRAVQADPSSWFA